MKIICLLVILAIIANCQEQIYSVDYQDGYVLRKGNPTPASLAWGYYKHDVMQDGWGKLFVETSNLFTSHAFSLKIYYAAGYLEGALTAEHIYNHYQSWFDYQFKSGTSPPSEALENFLTEQYEYSRQLVRDNQNDSFYQALERVLLQNEGIYRGMVDHGDKQFQISWMDMLLLQAAGDLYDIIPSVTPKSERIDWNLLSGQERWDEFERIVSCSALIKPLDDWSDVFVGHTTWTSYQNMLRVYKFFTFNGPKPYRIQFSAKPGIVYSKDDFYLLPDKKIVVMETTNGLQDSSIYEKIHPRTLLTWQRVPIAHSLSNGGEEWTRYFLQQNSGTYNNQYMVVDFKKLEGPGKPPQSDFLWISETMPVIGFNRDVTSVLVQQTYWPSYNVPYIKEIYDYAGYQKAFEKDGDEYSYEKCTRAQIFQRDQGNVKSLSDFKKMIRYNDWKNDPLSKQDASKSIANRSDLKTDKPKAFGAIDAKVTSASLVSSNTAWVQCGPTTDQQPAFEWGSWSGVRLGQPEKFDFQWVEMTI